MKYKTNELAEQLINHGGYAFATGYLTTFIENIPFTVKMTAKQEKLLQEYVRQSLFYVNNLKGLA